MDYRSTKRSYSSCGTVDHWLSIAERRRPVWLRVSSSGVIGSWLMRFVFFSNRLLLVSKQTDCEPPSRSKFHKRDVGSEWNSFYWYDVFYESKIRWTPNMKEWNEPELLKEISFPSVCVFHGFYITSLFSKSTMLPVLWAWINLFYFPQQNKLIRNIFK